MHTFDFHDFALAAPAENYQWIVSLIIPRPIAWVTTLSASGIVNLAPFSFFNGVCSNPPTLLISITPQPDGSDKDTLRNIRESGEFVVNVSSTEQAERINQTSKRYTSDESEFEAVKATGLPAQFVKPPRLCESPAQFECRAEQIVPVGDGSPGSAHVVFGRILGVHVSRAVMRDGRVDPKLVNPAARLGGISWAGLGELYSLKRPS